MQAVQGFLDKGTNPNLVILGKTALSSAARRQDPEVVKLLLDAKANPNLYYMTEKDGSPVVVNMEYINVDCPPMLAVFGWGDWKGWNEAPSRQTGPKLTPDEAGTIKALLKGGATRLYERPEGSSTLFFPDPMFLAVSHQNLDAVKALVSTIDSSSPSDLKNDVGGMVPTGAGDQEIGRSTLFIAEHVRVEDNDPQAKQKRAIRDEIIKLLLNSGYSLWAEEKAPDYPDGFDQGKAMTMASSSFVGAALRGDVTAVKSFLAKGAVRTRSYWGRQRSPPPRASETSPW